MRSSQPPSLRAGAAASTLARSASVEEIAVAEGSAFAGSVLPAFLALLAAVGGATRAASHRVACAAKRKKGVRVVNGKEIPWNLFGPKAPYKAKVVSNHKQLQTLTSQTQAGEPNWETCHITLDHGGNVPYLEGQSIGVLAPGPDKNGKTPAKPRLYSIASSATGDDESSNTVTVCVKRLVEVDGQHASREIGEDKPDKSGTAFPENRVYRGVSSNYVCDLSPGDEVMITGPTGAEMLLPDEDDTNIIMLATGTGIAPMRGYCRLLFHDKAGANPDGTRKFKGKVWLFLGVPHSESIIYDDEHQEYKSKYPDQFRYDYAVSREQKNAKGEKMYIQTKMGEYADEMWDLLQSPKTHVYMCGLKGMEKGIEECLGPLAAKSGVEWKDFAKKMKKDKRLHVEVY